MVFKSNEYVTLNSKDQKTKEQLRPIFRWAGSKRKLIPDLIRRSPSKFDRYIEPFSGSACLFFALRPSKAILGDINSELLLTYKSIRDYPEQVADTVHSYIVSSEKYYELRSLKPESLGSIERAARFIFLNRYCFNGVYRTNKKGSFNVPFGSSTGTIQRKEKFVEYSKLLHNVEFSIGDFEFCLKSIRSQDFVYLDPPYAIAGRKAIGEYGPDSFCERDIARLIDSCKRISNAGACFLLSYAAAPELTKMVLDSWHCETIQVRRHVAGFAKDRGIVPELLISNRPL